MKLVAFQFGYEVFNEEDSLGRVLRNGGAENYWTIEDDQVDRKYFTRASALKTLVYEKKLREEISELKWKLLSFEEDEEA